MSHPAGKLACATLAALIGTGVKDVVYYPGSRLVPFTYALDAACQADHLRIHVRLDERSAAFLALGLSKAGRSGEDGAGSEPTPSTLRPYLRPVPVAIIATSGRAVAELHAGITEAKHSRPPLLVISADHSAEMREVGASQTTSQPGIFSSHALEAPGLSAETASDQSLNARVRRLLAHAKGILTGAPGPVQLDVTFREPLIPGGGSTTPVPFLLEGESTKILHAPTPRIEWKEAVRERMCTLILVRDEADPDASAWASRAALPILAEPSSGLAWDENVIPHQQSLLSGLLARSVEQVIITRRPTLSRSVSMLLARTDLRLVIIDPGPEWTDISGNTALVAPRLSAPYEPVSCDQGSWLEEWREIALEVGGKITRLVEGGPLSILDIVRTVMAKDTRTLLLDTSNSVRAVDLVGRVGAKHLVVVNRELAGIDGTLTTGIGLALTRGEVVTTLLDDLAFCHNAGALAIPAEGKALDLLIIVADDSGGGVFTGLEHDLKEDAPTFECWSATAQLTSVRELAAAYGADYQETHTRTGLGKLIGEKGKGIWILQVPCSRPSVLVAVKAVYRRGEGSRPMQAEMRPMAEG